MFAYWLGVTVEGRRADAAEEHAAEEKIEKEAAQTELKAVLSAADEEMLNKAQTYLNRWARDRALKLSG